MAERENLKKESEERTERKNREKQFKERCKERVKKDSTRGSETKSCEKQTRKTESNESVPTPMHMHMPSKHAAQDGVRYFKIFKVCLRRSGAPQMS